MIWKTPVGRHSLFVVEDGWMLRDPLEFMPGSDPEVWAAHPEFIRDGKLRVSFGCFLLVGNEGVIVVDSGAGPGDPTPERVSGRLPAALGIIGINPADVSTVLHTHLHWDHFGGDASSMGEPFFPNARFIVHQREIDHWMTADNPAGDAVRAGFAPLVDAGLVDTIERDTEVAPGITMTETAGHTPGHMSVAVVSEGVRAFVTGDVTHHPLQAAHPDWNMFADVDPTAAIATRRRVFDELSDSGTLIAAGHYPRPGLGRIVLDDRFRIFMPAPFTKINP